MKAFITFLKLVAVDFLPAVGAVIAALIGFGPIGLLFEGFLHKWGIFSLILWALFVIVFVVGWLFEIIRCIRKEFSQCFKSSKKYVQETWEKAKKS